MPEAYFEPCPTVEFGSLKVNEDLILALKKADKDLRACNSDKSSIKQLVTN